MSGLFGVLDVASRALLVVGSGVRTTGHNIANVNTPGYSRQRPVLAPATPISTGAGLLGNGVEQRSVERASDGFVQRELMTRSASYGATQLEAQALAQIEEVLNEQQGEGLSAALSRLYAAFEDLASSTTPRAPAERESVRAEARSLVDTIHHADAQLRQLQRATDASITSLLPEINALAQRINAVNQEIARSRTFGPPNDLLDERDRLLRELSGKIQISSFEASDGKLVVMLPSGLPLVEGATARRLEAEADPANPFDPTFSRVVYADGTNRFDISDEIGGGELGGLLRTRDTLLPAAIRSLDTVAYNLAVSVNAVHAAGVGLDGSTGNFFAAPAAVEDAARDLALEGALAASADAIAAGLTTGASDNRNALALAALRTTAAPLYLPGDPPGPASGPLRSVLEHAASVIADVGQQSRNLAQAQAQEARVLELLENRRDEISGVSLDEEVTNLIRLQAAFQANARVVSAVERLLQDLVEIL